MTSYLSVIMHHHACVMYNITQLNKNCKFWKHHVPFVVVACNGILLYSCDEVHTKNNCL